MLLDTALNMCIRGVRFCVYGVEKGGKAKSEGGG